MSCYKEREGVKVCFKERRFSRIYFVTVKSCSVVLDTISESGVGMRTDLWAATI